MRHSLMKQIKPSHWLGCLGILLVLLAGCGGAGMSAPTANPAQQSSFPHNAAGNAQQNAPGGQQQVKDPGPQYLIKNLKVSMQVKDSRKVADDLLTWVLASDPHASSAGSDYQQTGDNLYTISLTFSIPASSYPAAYRYLRDYTVTKQPDGRLTGFTETVQDVSNNYVDTKARVQTLQDEQNRLRDLMNHAQVLGDILTLEQKLTDVETQIETSQLQLNTLDSQVQFYNVSVNLQPIDTGAPPPPAPTNGWSVGQVLHDAFAASLAFAQGLATFLIWLLAFALYIVPVALIIWFARRWYTRTQRIPQPKTASSTSPTAHEE